MTRFRSALLLVFSIVASQLPPQRAVAQETPADTAAVLLAAATTLDREGKHDVAEELMRYVMRRYPETLAAADARRMLTGVRRAQELGAGRTGFVIWNTLFASWLGIAVPAALGADESAPYGVGLLVGAPLGFFASNAYARRHPLTLGQGALYQLSTGWLSWQALGWQQVFDIGEECWSDPWGEYCSGSDTAPWTALVIGGLAGVGTGIFVTNWDVEDGTAALMRHGALWGTWYGLALGVLADAENDGLLAWTLLGGDIGLAAGLPVGRAWRPSAGQVRLVTAAGLAGGLVGGGVDLLLETDDEKTAIAIPLLGTTVGIIAGTLLVSGRPDTDDGEFDTRSALLQIDGRATVGLPTPLPTAIPSLSEDGRVRHRPGVRVPLLHLSF